MSGSRRTSPARGYADAGSKVCVTHLGSGETVLALLKPLIAGFVESVGALVAENLDLWVIERAGQTCIEVRACDGHSCAGASSVPLNLAVTPLSPAERRVLRLLPSYLSCTEMAACLGVSKHTVKSHCRGIYQKLEVTTRGAAIGRARELGLLIAAAPIDPDRGCDVCDGRTLRLVPA